MHIQKLSVAILLSMAVVSSCKDGSDYYPNAFSDGKISIDEEYVVENDYIESNINMEGGDVCILGNTTVHADINMNDPKSELIISGEKVNIQKINMQGGDVKISGNCEVDRDLNFNSGRITIGNDKSTIADTVRIYINFNIFGDLLIQGGVVVVEHDFNQNKGVVCVTDGAKLIVKGSLNQGSELYGKRNIVVKGEYNQNAPSLIDDEPCTCLNYSIIPPAKKAK